MIKDEVKPRDLNESLRMLYIAACRKMPSGSDIYKIIKRMAAIYEDKFCNDPQHKQLYLKLRKHDTAIYLAYHVAKEGWA